MSTIPPSTQIYHCDKAGCTFFTTSKYSFDKHRCRQAKKRRTDRIISSFTTSNSYELGLPGTEHSDSPNSFMSEPQHPPPDPNVVDPFHKTKECIDQFCDIVCQSSDYKTLKALKSIIALLHSSHFDISFFRKSVTDIQSCKKWSCSKFTEQASTEGFRKKKASLNIHGSQHVADYFHRDIQSVLKEQVQAASPEDIIIQPSDCAVSDNSSIKHPMQSSYFRNRYNVIRNTVICSKDKSVVWYDDHKEKSFVGFVQLFTDKTKSSLKIGGMTAYVIHATFLNFTKKFRQHLIQTGKTIVGFLPTDSTLLNSPTVSIPDVQDLDDEYDINDVPDTITEDSAEQSTDKEIIALLDKVLLTSTAKGREIAMGLLHNAIDSILDPLYSASAEGFEIPFKNVILYCFPTLVSYCCDIPEAKDITACRHNMNTNCPCHRCFVTLEDIQLLRHSMDRLFEHTLTIRKEVLHRAKGRSNTVVNKSGDHCQTNEDHQSLLQKYSLSPWTSFLERVVQAHSLFIPRSLYDIFTYEPLHNLHLGISKMLKQLTFHLVGSDKEVHFCNAKKKGPIKFHTKKMAILRACNSLLRAFEKSDTISSLHIDFSTKDNTCRLNGILLEAGVRGMLEGKDYRNLDFVFPFVAAYVDKISGCTSNGLTLVHTMYSDLLTVLLDDVERDGVNDDSIRAISKRIASFKKECVKCFSPYVSNGLFTLKFHLLDHLTDDLKRYGSLSFLSAGPYEYFNTIVEKHYRTTSKRTSTALSETIASMSSEMDSQQNDPLIPTHILDKHITASDARSQYLVRDGLTVTFRQLKLSQDNGCDVKIKSLISELQTVLPPTDFGVLVKLISEEIIAKFPRVLDYGTTLTFVKSGYIHSFKIPTLKSFCKQSKKILYSPDDSARQTKKRIFATSRFGPTKKAVHSCIFMKGRDPGGSEEEYWFAQIIALFRITSATSTVQNDTFSQEYAFVKFFMCTPPKDEIDNILNCVCLRWETEDGIDHSSEEITGSDTITAGEQYGVVPLKSICGTCDIIRSNYAIHPFTQELPWTHHRFYVNRFRP